MAFPLFRARQYLPRYTAKRTEPARRQLVNLGRKNKGQCDDCRHFVVVPLLEKSIGAVYL